MIESSGVADRDGAVPVPLRVGTDPALGGRWTSLRTNPGRRTGQDRADGRGGREWLWRGTADGRERVRPGDAFIDAGGLEECVPTVRGTPDHGDAWSRPWPPSGPGTATVSCPDFRLTRRLVDRDGSVVADYRLTARPGYRFVWAAHALLDLSAAATVDAPAGTPTRLYPEAATLVADGRWPAEAPWRTESWPEPAGIPLHRLGPNDGTAVGAILVGCPVVHVLDGSDRLTMRLEAPGQPVSVALWRNLRGWPHGTPYRSTGVEPMLGAVFDRDGAPPADVAVVPASGEVRWRLTITAAQLTIRADHAFDGERLLP